MSVRSRRPSLHTLALLAALVLSRAGVLPALGAQPANESQAPPAVPAAPPAVTAPVTAPEPVPPPPEAAPGPTAPAALPGLHRHHHPKQPPWVAAANPLAVDAGLEILAKGGRAVDAAAAEIGRASCRERVCYVV